MRKALEKIKKITIYKVFIVQTAHNLFIKEFQKDFTNVKVVFPYTTFTVEVVYQIGKFDQ